MATKEKEKVGIDQLAFLPLGADESIATRDQEEEVIVDDTDDDEERAGMEDAKTPPVEQEDEEELELGADEGTPPASENEDEDEIIDEEEIEEGDEDDEDDSPEPSIFESALKGSDLELSDPSFEGINMDDPTTEDLSKFVDVVSDKISDKKLNGVFEKYPEAKGFLEFAKNGGDPRQYIETMYPQFDYSQVDFEEQVAENEAAQEQLVRTQLQAEGTETEEIDELVEDYRAGGLLAKQSKRALNKLSKLQADQQEQLVKEQEKAIEARKEAAKKQRESIETIIEDSDSIQGLTLPKTDKEDLKTYLFEPVNDQGQSQAYVDGNEMSHEERVAVAYLKMKGFDFESLIGNEAETRQAKKLKSSIKKSKDEKVTRKRDKTKRTSGKIQDIKPIF